MNTRFSLAAYHDLHIGHIYIAQANWAKAFHTGGKFVLHIHDTPYYLKRCAQSCFPLPMLVDRHIEDLEWLGLSPDEVMWSSRNAEAHWEANQRLVPQVPRYYGTNRTITTPDANPSIEHPYHPWHTFTSAVDDHTMEIGGFYRGDDLRPQAELYDYFCCALGWRTPCQNYMPTIRHELTGPKVSKSDNSDGDDSIRSLREAGYVPEDIMRGLVQMIREHGDEHLTSDGRVFPANDKQLIIPDGYLTTANVRPIELDRFADSKVAPNPLGGKPFELEAKAHIKRVRARINKSLRAQRKAAAKAAKKRKQGGDK